MAQLSKKDALKDIAYAPDGTPVPKSALKNKGLLEALGAALAKQREKLKDYTITPVGTPIPKSPSKNTSKQTAADTAKQTGKGTQEKLKSTASASSRTPIRQNSKLAPVLPEGYAYTPDNTPVPESALHNPGVLETFNTSIAKQQEKLKDYTVTPEGIRIPKDFKPAPVLPEGYAYTPDGTLVPESAFKSTERPEPISMAKQTGEQIETPNVPGYEKYDALLKEIWNKDTITAEDSRRIREAIEEIAPSVYKRVGDWDTAKRYAELLMKLPQTDFLGRLYKGLNTVLEGAVGSTVYGVEAVVQQSKNIQEGHNKAVEQNRGKAMRPEDIRIEPGTETVSKDSFGSRLMKGSQEAADLTTYGLSDAEKFAVNTTMSVVQNALNIAVGGEAAPVLMAVQSGGQTAYDIGRRGGTMTQQMQGGFAAAAAEFAGESFSFRGLEDIVKNPAVGLIAGIKRIGAQMGIEFGEEAATEVMNIVSDLLVMGDKADLAQYYQQFKAANPDANALWPTILKAVSQVGLSGLAGAVSGGVMSSGAQLMSRGTLQQMGGQMRSTESLNELIETGKSLDPASSAYRMAARMETRTNAGKKVSDLDIGRQYAANQIAEEAEQRAAFQTDLDAAGMDKRAAKAALHTYDKLVQGESINQRSAEKLQGGYDRLAQGKSESKRAAEKLQASLRSAAAQKAEINTDSNVTKTEAMTRLQPLYSAMQRAAQTNDFAAFQTAKDQYTQSFALEQAKHQATKVRAQNRINAIDNNVKTEISDAETAVKGLSPATAIDNGFEDAAAETTGQGTDAGSAVQDAANGAAGRESILGNAAKDEAQGQLAASTVAGNGGILNPEGTGSEQGPGGSVGDVGKSAIDYTKRSEELEKRLEVDGYKIIYTKTAEQANTEWSDMGFDKPPVASGTKVYNIEAGNKSYSRVYCEGYNYPKSRFVLRTENIDGLSAQEIADKYALPRVPNKIVHITIPENIPLEVTIVGPQEFNGIKTSGGDIQYAIKDIELMDEWFENIEDLK